MDDGHGKLTFGQGATPTPESANDVRHCQEFTELHVITKNVQSIREPSRFDDFLAEIDTCDFDILCICETWRGDDSESWTTTMGHKLFFSGGSTHCGVGIGIGRKLALEISHVHFHAFSERVCALHVTIFNVKFQIFSVYFPTSWEHDEVVEQVYDLLTVLMSTCVREGATPLVAGDFNASIGRALPHDEIEFLGFCGCGHRNARGWSLIDWVLGNGLLIQNRMDTTMNNDASWTCHRSFDGALVQLDFVVSCSRMTLIGVGVITVFLLVWTIDVFTASLPSCHGNLDNVR